MGAIEWTWLAWALESAVLRTAALIGGIIIVARMAVWVYRGAKSAEALAVDVAKMRALVHGELTDDNDGSVKSDVSRLIELVVAHLADSELQHHRLAEQLAEQGIQVDAMSPRERWQWINGLDRTEASDEGDE